jgi:cold shock CspA family protein
MPRGKVKWFNDKNGFGFLVDPLIDGDIFVHYSVIEGGGFRTLCEGEEVDYELAEGANGTRASRVIRINPPPVPPPQKHFKKVRKPNGPRSRFREKPVDSLRRGST